jgi:hypothetical protein
MERLNEIESEESGEKDSRPFSQDCKGCVSIGVLQYDHVVEDISGEFA